MITYNMTFEQEKETIDKDLVKINLGERINKHNIFRFVIPASPNLPKSMGGLAPNIFLPNGINYSLSDNLCFFGIENIANVKKVTFIIKNYLGVHHVPGHLEDGIWRLSPLPLPLHELLEYSEQMRLEVEIELATQKKRFYQFNAFYVKQDKVIEGLHEIPTYDNEQKIQFVSKIWRMRTVTSKTL